MAGSTLFQVHHAQALRTSRRLSLFFWGGVLFTIVAYAAIGLCVKWISGEKGNFAFFCIAVIPPLILLYGYYQARQDFKSRNLDTSMTQMGASAIKDLSKQRERRLVNVVEEMSIAAGVHPPTPYVLRGT